VTGADPALGGGTERIRAVGELAYLDTSAYVKLVLREPERAALEAALRRWPARISSVLLRVEAERACARYGEQPWVERARDGLASLALLPLDEAVLRGAAALRPAGLRTLDAIHLATALSTGRRLGVLFSYDDRLCDAARDAGVPVERPA
jgi:predicted nucleic acid-binding protein